MPRTIAIGDIHGCSIALAKLIEVVAAGGRERLLSAASQPCDVGRARFWGAGQPRSGRCWPPPPRPAVRPCRVHGRCGLWSRRRNVAAWPRHGTQTPTRAAPPVSVGWPRSGWGWPSGPRPAVPAHVARRSPVPRSRAEVASALPDGPASQRGRRSLAAIQQGLADAYGPRQPDAHTIGTACERRPLGRDPVEVVNKREH